jgi:hypothetical protein
VDTLLFHEGRGARKTDLWGGHVLVSRKKIVKEKEKLAKKKVTGKRNV